MLCAAIAVFGFTKVNAQDNGGSTALSEGSMLVEINTGSFTTGSTAISFASSDGSSIYSVGAEGGYFVSDNLAVKVGLGYQGSDEDGPLPQEF